MCGPVTSGSDCGAGSAAQYEDEHVHQVYQSIASHFSSTRHKPWPVVAQFLHDQPIASVGIDVGCGNGKYLAVRDDVFIVGSDRSSALAEISKKHLNHDTVVADTLSLPYSPRRFDFAICIAVIHHLSTITRRVSAIRSVLDGLKREYDRSETRTGQALFLVWALEQKSSRRGWDEGQQQDIMVPWVLKDTQRHVRSSSSSLGSGATASTTFQRYYHLYKFEELEHDIEAAGGEVLSSGYEKDNWWAVAVPS